MKIKFLLLSLLLTAVSAVRAQMPSMALPLDTAVRIGRLSNGLTYYIRYNNWPEHRANFYIAQKVGSIEEEESQRGLAHFLEHMAFNGSDHFKGNDLIEWCRSKGIEFGGDLNAYTSIDETVYNIDNVPTQHQATLDSCLLILRDWSTGLSLEQDEIEKERGVIHEEWRLRTSAMSRMFERNLPQLYPGSKYGLRYPIGLMSVVDNFKRQELVDYYHKWYHPSHQGLIIVGDVDVQHVEAQIKQLFGSIKNPANEAPLVNEAVPDNATPIVVIDHDKEQKTSVVDLMMKHDVVPDSVKQTLPYLLEEYGKNAVFSMLGNRFTEAAQKADCPYVEASVDDGAYIFSKTKDAFSLSVSPKDVAQVSEALKAAYTEVRRAAKYGFTATEYQRYQENYLSALDKVYSNRDKRYNETFYEECKNHFLDNEPMPGLDFTYATMKHLVPTIPLEAINQVLPSLISNNDSNLVIVNFNNEKEGVVYPTREQLLDAVHSARAAQLSPYTDHVKNEPLISKLPKAGKIKKESRSTKFGYTTLQLSNGVTVLLKKTDYKKDQVLLNGTGGSGASNYGPQDAANLKLFNSAIGASGLGHFSNVELRKALAGKIANADLSMNGLNMGISGNATPKDVETMLQMTYLYFTAINKDTDAFGNLMQQNEVALKNRSLDPMTAFSDSLTNALYDHNWYRQPLVYDDLKHANYDRILQMARERTANATGWVFTLTGNFDESTIRQLVCRYLGALPSKGKAEKLERIDQPTEKNVDNTFYRKMETPKAIAYMVWLNRQVPYTLENTIRADIAGQILSMEYLKKIREDASAAYTCGSLGTLSIGNDGFHVMQLIGYCPMKPEKKEIALHIMKEEVSHLAEQCNAEMLDKVKTVMLKQFDDQTKTNGFWDDIIELHHRFGFDNYTDYKQLVAAQTPADIAQFIKTFLAGANRVTVTMLPQE